MSKSQSVMPVSSVDDFYSVNLFELNCYFGHTAPFPRCFSLTLRYNGSELYRDFFIRLAEVA